MSGYYFHSYHFVVREDRGPELKALTAVAEGRPPSEEALQQIHPVPRICLADIRTVLHDEAEPRSGGPVRLARSNPDADRTRMSIEFCLHDDAFADGGYMFWLWVMSLVDSPKAPQREVIGYSGLYRNDPEMGFVIATADAIIDRNGVALSYDEITDHLADWTAWASWRF